MCMYVVQTIDVDYMTWVYAIGAVMVVFGISQVGCCCALLL